jgi:hypothetical protein
VFGNRAIANVALRSQFGAARFRGGFFGSAWPWWRGGLVLGWFGPLFWPYAHYDLFDYVYWPYAYDDFWPYAYDDVYYGIYGPYAYYGPYGASRASGRVSSARYGSARYATTTNGSARRAAEVCSNQAPELTDWPMEGISEVVQPTDAQRPALEELRAASAKAIDMLRRVPKGPAEHPDRTARGDGEPAAGHACRCADRTSGARALLPIAQRRAEGALQRHRAGG